MLNLPVPNSPSHEQSRPSQIAGALCMTTAPIFFPHQAWLADHAWETLADHAWETDDRRSAPLASRGAGRGQERGEVVAAAAAVVVVAAAS